MPWLYLGTITCYSTANDHGSYVNKDGTPETAAFSRLDSFEAMMPVKSVRRARPRAETSASVEVRIVNA